MADPGRAQVAARGLTAAAVGALVPLMGDVGFEELGLVKSLLKRFFSIGPWTALDAAALAGAVGPPPETAGGVGGVDVVRHRLDADLELVAGWVDGRFVLDVEVGDAPSPPSGAPRAALDLGATFDSDVVPQPTPNPRTIRFATGRRDLVGSHSFRRDDARGDERVAAIFAVDDDVLDVLVAPDFVAVSLARPGRWPDLLPPVLEAVVAGFSGEHPSGGEREQEITGPDVRGVSARAGAGGTEAVRGRPTRLDRAWADLGRLDARRAADLEEILAATRDRESARRQVAAQLLDAAPEDAAAEAWSAMLDDPSRAVRRTVVDAAAGAERASLRPLLERATTDADAWVRWKALHGLAALGVGTSRSVVDQLTEDPDFRVRLEAENALRR